MHSLLAETSLMESNQGEDALYKGLALAVVESEARQSREHGGLRKAQGCTSSSTSSLES